MRPQRLLGSWAAAAAIATALALNSQPAGARYSQDVQDLVEHGRSVQQNAAEYLGDFRPDSSEAVETHREWMEVQHKASRDNVLDLLQAEAGDAVKDVPAEPDAERHLVVFASFSLGDVELRTIAESIKHSGLPGLIVFQGIGEDERINDFVVRVNPLLEGLEGRVESTLDPTAFDDHGVRTVPHMQIRDASDQVIIEASGLINPRILLNRLEAGDSGRLRRQGPTEDIAERNLIEVMKERFAAIDWEGRQQEALDAYWQHADLQPLRPARETTERRVDPRVQVQQDILDAHGNVLTPAGTIINPLEMRPFTRRLVIVDPTRPEETEWFRALENAPGLRDIVMITDLDRDSGWDGLVEAQNILGGDIYVLTRDVRSRFQIRATPTVVTSDGTHFLIHEFDVKQGNGQAPGASQ